MALIDTVPQASSFVHFPAAEFSHKRKFAISKARSVKACAMKAFPRETFFSSFAINLFYWKLFHISVYHHVHFHFRPKTFSFASFFIFFFCASFGGDSFPLLHPVKLVFMLFMRSQGVEEEISCGHFLRHVLDISSDVVYNCNHMKIRSTRKKERREEGTKRSGAELKSKYINRCPWNFHFLNKSRSHPEEARKKKSEISSEMIYSCSFFFRNLMLSHSFVLFLFLPCHGSGVGIYSPKQYCVCKW